MIKLAIAPVLDGMHYANLGDIHFILANYYIKFPRYREYFLAHKGEKFTIVDNGAYEFGAPLDMKTLCSIYEEAGANELILPDVEYDWEQTKKLSLDALQYLEASYDKHEVGGDTVIDGPSLQYVLQGSSYPEMVSNCSQFVHERELSTFRYWNIRKFGVPLYKKNWQDRIYAVKELALGTVLPFHLLGLHDPIELAVYKRRDLVFSADGGFAAKFGCYNMKWSLEGEFIVNKTKYPNDIEKLEVTIDSDKSIKHNVDIAKKLASRHDNVVNGLNKIERNQYLD